MKPILLSVVAVVYCGTLNAAEFKALETFDFYAAPVVGGSGGSYQAGDVDEGSMFGAHFGARAGFKLGPILLGGEFASVNGHGSSSKNHVSAEDQVKYAVDHPVKITSAGLNIGLYSDRVVLWGHYYPVTSMETNFQDGIKRAENSYYGTSYTAELSFRVWDRMYLGVFGTRREFTKYDTTHSSKVLKDADLTPSIIIKSYGMTLSYLFPFSELAKLKDFPGLK